MKPCGTVGANGSCASLVDGEKNASEDEKGLMVGSLSSLSSSPPRIGARIVRNVSAQRTRSPSVPPYTPTTGITESTLNGDTRGHAFSPQSDEKNISITQLPLSTSSSPEMRTSKSPARTNGKLVGASSPDTERKLHGHDAPQSPVRPSSRSQQHVSSRSLSPSKLPRHEQRHPPSEPRLQQLPVLEPPAPAHVRVKAPQPVYAETTGPLSPVRTVGLRA